MIPPGFLHIADHIDRFSFGYRDDVKRADEDVVFGLGRLHDGVEIDGGNAIAAAVFSDLRWVVEFCQTPACG